MVKSDFKNIDEYISTFPNEIQEILESICKTIKEAAPKATETISYQMPTFKLNGKNLVHFAAFKNHISFFPTPSGVSAFEKNLKSYRTSKGTIQFPLDKPIPYDLIKKIVEFRLWESTSKKV